MLDLTRTRDLHTQLAEVAAADPGRFAAATDTAQQALRAGQANFERSRAMPAAVSALALEQEGVAQLAAISESLHAIVERALDWVLADEGRLLRYFGKHQRLFPYLGQRTPGLDTWQGYSRYDAVVTDVGEVKIIELNTCCPAGFCHGEIFSAAVQPALAMLDLDADVGETFGTIPQTALIEELLAVEQAAGLEPNLIGLVNDENGLENELELFAGLFAERGREAVIAPAAELGFRNGQLQLAGRTLSLTYNKIRISTADSPNHNWAAGFEQRYAGFLEALASGTVVSVNNLTAATIAENKVLLTVLADETFAAELSPSERQLVADHVLWTVPLADGKTTRNGETINLLPYVRAHREQLVIKPANEGRGFRVVVGKFATAEQWEAACQIRDDLPCVVQEYAESVRLPVVAPRQDEAAAIFAVQPMYLTLALGIIRGRYRGLFSRVSPEPITNVGRAGLVQAVFVSR
ncbi:MAG: hypothetical protein DWQ42_09190 [Planctomycetota bacterium]|nr:MAG: hypothetical protein DWQ42_09190 [Planctomycetota bacterium]REK37935.1 MAG: hypothetical protein DWQ46_21370 [Planctomycetota bacterium]